MNPSIAGHPARTRSDRVAANPDVHPALRWAFYLFLLSLPIESLGIADAPVTVTRILGYVLLLASLLQPRACFSWKPAALWWFTAFLGVCAALGPFQPDQYLEEALGRVFTLVQMLVLFWIACNLLRSRQIAAGALTAIVASCVLAALLQLVGFKEEIDPPFT